MRTTFKEIEVYVPHIAASGGTLIALTGDKIVTGMMSQLSPLDPQIRYKGRAISALTFRHAYDRLCKTFEKKHKEEAPYPQQALADKLDPFVMEEWNASLQAMEDYANEILRLANYGEEKAWEIAHALVTISHFMSPMLISIPHGNLACESRKTTHVKETRNSGDTSVLGLEIFFLPSLVPMSLDMSCQQRP